MRVINNKYRRWYNQIIERASSRILVNDYEKHHIKPRSLGGSDTKQNIVNLTYREHFLVHWLLTKFTIGNDRRKMIFALTAMSRTKGNRIVTGWQYELTKRKMAQIMLGREAWNKGKNYKHRNPRQPGFKMPERSQQWREKQSFTKSGKVHSNEVRAKMSASHLGRKHSEETKRKISAALKGKKRSPDHCSAISRSLKKRAFERDSLGRFI